MRSILVSLLFLLGAFICSVRAEGAQSLSVYRQLEDQTSTQPHENSTEASNAGGEVEKKGSFWAGFAQAFSLIFVSEIGDKTFILVTIYASKFAWYWVLPIAILGMSIMHSLSTGLGMIFVLFVPRVWTQSVAILLFWLMGFYSLYQGVREYVERARRKAKGLPETESESEDERAELEKIVREQEAIAAGQKAEVSQESQPAEAKDIELAIPDGERNEDPAPAGGEAPEIKDAPASEPATKVEPSKEEPKAQEK